MRLLTTLLSFTLLPCVLPEAALSAPQAAPHVVTMLYDARFSQHVPGAGHPETAERLLAIVSHLQSQPGFTPYLRWSPFQTASRTDLLRVHSADYLDTLQREQARIPAGQHSTLSTGDTELSEQSLAVASLASGAVIAGVDAVIRGDSRSAFALIRPPGHHASASRGMGFCVDNHVAVAARYAQHQHGLQRILIVDIDVHHGNGTQAIFEADPDVFYFSAHQSPLYPGTGQPSERGVGAGLGTTMNIAIPRESDGATALQAIRGPLALAMQQFRPQLILVSAGLDAHAGDTLGGLRYSDADYAAIIKSLNTMAHQYAQGRMVLALEGGYVPANNASAVEAMLRVLIGLTD